MKKYIGVSYVVVEVWYGKDVVDKCNIGIGEKFFFFVNVLFDVVGMDIYIMYCVGMFIIEGSYGF